ncbi:hypothetical protein MAR_013951 [Mya arenaria]|uniref:Uncharacterized protein n=1 Tax=Mya arenaria TaxID=6604 RepID=A0ABY7G2V6_MYAAR|nr:uncharacterized protein LOC128218952 isoform X3 [Mya arenaria]WAR28247.1 hypothetical protein MAR_013951 [Mya arenaria]
MGKTSKKDMGKAQGNRTSRSVRKPKSRCKTEKKIRGTFPKKSRSGVSTRDELRLKSKRCLSTPKGKLFERIRRGGGKSASEKKGSFRLYANPYSGTSGPQPHPANVLPGGVNRPSTSLPKPNLPK